RDFTPPPTRAEDMDAAVERAAQRARGARRHVLLVDDLLPSTGIGAGFSRPIQMLHDLRADNVIVSICPLVGAARTSDLLRDLGVRVVGADNLERYLSRPDIVIDAAIISRATSVPVALDLIRRTQPTAAVIMDHEALYHRRLERQAEMAPDAARRDELTA